MTNLAPIVEMLKTLHETTNPDQAVLVVRSESEAEKETGRIQSSAHPETKLGHELVSNSEVDDFLQIQVEDPGL